MLIPFEKQIPVDKRRPLGELVAHARRESSPIFNWLLDGWLKYKAQGLAIPEKVRLATQEYRDESDTLAQFIAEVCVAPGEACTTDFHKAYVEWSGSAISQKGLFNSMKEKGFQIRQGARRKRFWIGIGLAAEEGRA